MALTNLVYPSGKQAIEGSATYGGPIDWDADPIYLMLVTSNYTNLTLATAQGHHFRSDVTGVAGAEASGTGYTAGGVQLTSVAIAASGNNAIVNAANASWASSTITATGAVVFKRVGADLTTPADDPILCYLDFGGTISSTAGTFTVNLSNGILLAS